MPRIYMGEASSRSAHKCIRHKMSMHHESQNIFSHVATSYDRTQRFHPQGRSHHHWEVTSIGSSRLSPNKQSPKNMRMIKSRSSRFKNVDGPNRLFLSFCWPSPHHLQPLSLTTGGHRVVGVHGACDYSPQSISYSIFTTCQPHNNRNNAANSEPTAAAFQDSQCASGTPALPASPAVNMENAGMHFSSLTSTTTGSPTCTHF
jgi:hypothetical protein